MSILREPTASVSAVDYDVVAAEVHRKAIENLTNEMAITLIRTSGSPVVVEVRDFSTCVMDTTPEHLGFAAYVTAHFGSSLVGVKATAERAARSGDLRPGDGWLVNDPYTGGALHQADVGVIMPTFGNGEHIGWSFANMHVLDVGGVGISGYAPGARDVYQEGLRFPPVRAIRHGALDPEWESFIAANVRTPGPVINDIRTLIATNNTAAQRLSEIVSEFGLERHLEYCSINKDLSEQLIRDRISRIPDGEYEAVDWNEFDGNDGPDLLLEMRVKLTVDGSNLRFTFSGVPQIGAFVNSAPGAMYGTTVAALLPMLAYGDLPVNGGVWRPITIEIGEPGSIVNAALPAPVSNAHSEVGARATKLAREALNQALSASEDPELRARVAGQGQESYPGLAFFTRNQHGGDSVLFYIDTATGNGGPAQTVADGIETYGYTNMTGCGLPDVETHEAIDPLLILWRRMSPNTAGPGLRRGGFGLEQAFALQYSDYAGGPAFNACAEVPPRGFGGGLPAAAGAFHILRNTNIADLLARGRAITEDTLNGERVDLPSKNTHVEMRRGDVFVLSSGSGGGLGDPLLRPPALVAKDLGDGSVTRSHAARVYGVVVDDRGVLDSAGTDALRTQIRTERIGRAPIRPATPPSSVGVSVIQTPATGRWACASCEADLGPLVTDWRDSAEVIVRESTLADRFLGWEMQVRGRSEPPGVLLREYFCAACGGLLSSDVTAA